MPIQFEHKLAVPLGNSYQHTKPVSSSGRSRGAGAGGWIEAFSAPLPPGCELGLPWFLPSYDIFVYH